MPKKRTVSKTRLTKMPSVVRIATSEAPSRIVEKIYVEVPSVLHPAAEQSVTMHLLKLIEENRVIDCGGGRYGLASA